MNNKYVFNGNDWIVTSGEIVVTPLDGTRPMHPAQSKKLYDQNMQHYTQHKKPGIWWQIQYNAIKEIVTTIDKYTIVELTHNNKHYHGLTSRADGDKENAVSGIAVAYHRAFDKMMQHHKTNVVDETPTHKAKTWKEIWATNKFKTSAYCQGLKRFTEDTSIDDIIHTKSKLVDKAISDLLACTGVELRQYDLKTVHGAKDALEEISKYGYNIYELQNTDPLNLTYVLKQYGTEITRRDIKLTMPTDRFDETQNNLKRFSEDQNTGLVFHIKSGKKVT